MKFGVLGREVELRPIHVLYVIAVEMAYILVFMAALVAATLALTGGVSPESIADTNVSLIGAITIVAQPLTAFLLLGLSGFAGLRKDVGLCRSLAVSRAAISLGFWFLGVLASLGIGIATQTPMFSAAASIGGFLAVLYSAIVMYLWLLIFLKPEKANVKDAAARAVAFAVIYFIVQGAAVVLMSHASDSLAAVQLDTNALAMLVGSAMLAFPLIYHLGGKEDRRAMYAFAALYIGATAVSNIPALLSGDAFGAVAIAERAVELLLIYAIARKDILKTF